MNVAPPLQVLIVEDDPDVAQTLRRVVETCGSYEVTLALTAQRLHEALRADGRPDIVFTDLVMPEINGLEVIRLVHERYRDVPVIVLSAFATLDNAVEAVKMGAFDFLPKPFSLESVELALTKVGRERLLQQQLLEATKLLANHDATPFGLIGSSAAMRQVGEWIYRARQVRANVLIEGESGTGKELVARALHGGQGPFVAVNVATIPDALAEAELFGYRRGAFTGAQNPQAGFFAQADGGSLFLDEVNSMTAAVQAKLLRVLSDGRYRPLGAADDEQATVRVISASNSSLEACVETGKFRRDLFHRLKVLHLRLPPLRERLEDLPQLTEHLIQRYARLHRTCARGLTPRALQYLAGQDWPGNVRELENAIEQAVIFTAPGDTLIDARAFDLARDESAAPVGLSHRDGVDAMPLEPLAAAEMRHIQRVLSHTGGNKSQAARLLEIDYKTLLRKLAASDKGIHSSPSS